MALPTLTVLLDDGTGTFPTNISARVRAFDGWEISRGRADWQGAVTAGELHVTLDNSDGFFTTGAGAVFVDQQVRLSETVNGVTYVRFTGYVKSWPTSWPATVVTVSTVQPTATDAQARAERTTLRSMLEEEILLDSPSAYYTLGEPQGSTSAGDTSGSQAPPLTFAGSGAAVVFGNGTGPGVDGLTAAQFAGGQYLSTGNPSMSIAAPTTYGIAAAFLTTINPAVTGNAVIALSDGWRLQLPASNPGTIQGTGPGFAITSTVLVNDGLTHTAVLLGNGTTATLVVDGAINGTAAIGSATTTPLDQVGDPTFVGTISHFATFPALTVAQAQNIASVAVGITESGTARITRLAAYAGIPVGTLDTSLTNIGNQATSGASAFAAIQDVADAEGGLVFIDGSGNLTFHNRDRPTVKTTPDLILDRQWVTPDVQPVLDDQTLVNYFETTAQQTGSTQLVFDTASETLHGRYPESKTYMVLTDQEALDRANWAVAKLATPVPRYGTLTINLYGDRVTASMANTVLAALDLNCWLRVTSLASQTLGGTTADVVVEGWQEQVTAESWTVTCNVVARSLFVAFLLNDATYGLLDSTIPLGY